SICVRRSHVGLELISYRMGNSATCLSFLDSGVSGGDMSQPQPIATHSKQEIARTFQQMFEFTAEDVVANQQRRLSESQGERLPKGHLTGRGAIIGLYFGLGLLILF